VDPDDDYWEPPVEGSVLRVMWDENAGPLWGDDGLLPEEPEWMHSALGLSDSLIADLLQWMSDMTGLQFGPLVGNSQLRQQQLRDLGADLAQRLQAEVGTRYRVRFRG